MNDLLNWPGGFAAAFLFAVVGAALVRITRDHCDTLPLQTGAFLVAFGVRFAASLAIYGGGLVSVVQDEDSRGWTAGITFMQRWIDFGFTDSSVLGVLGSVIRTENTGYQSLLGVFFMLTRLVGRLPATAFTAFIGAFAVVLTYRTARVLATERAARWVAAAVALVPLMIVWSSQTLKEPVVITIEAAAFYALVRIGLGSGALRHLLLALAAFVLVIPFRFYIAYALGAALVFVVWRHRAYGLIARAATTAAVVVMLALLTQSVFKRENPGLQRVQQFRESVSPGGTAVAPPRSASAVPAAAHAAPQTSVAQRTPAVGATAAPSRAKPQLATLDVRKPWQIPLVLLIGSAYALLSPFPWQFNGGSWRFLLTAPDMLIWWVIFFAAVVPGVWRALRTRLLDVAPLVVFLLMIGGLYSLMFANVGIAYRQRAQLLPVLLLVAAAGLRPKDRVLS